MKAKKNIIETQLTLKKAPNHIIKRDRLIRLLSNNVNKNLIIVHSPAGYGKTALIQDFLSTIKWKYAWLNATDEFNQIYTFFNYLVLSLRKINKKFGKNTINLLESRKERYQLSVDSKTVINDVVSTFINEFKYTFSKDVILVIDDFQNLHESRWIKKTFNILFENIPKNLHLVIITRQLLDLNYIPFIKQGNILKIGMEDLIFRFNEIIDLLQKIYSIKCGENDVKLLENNLGGWITGIHLMLKSYGKNFNQIKLDYQKIPENIFNILANEIFRKLDNETKNFLLITAPLDNFNIDLCNRILKAKNSSSILVELISKELFIQVLNVDATNGHDKTTYTYNNLFKKFLISKLNELKSQDSVKELLRNVSDYFREQNDPYSAINYLMLAKDYNAAIDYIIKNFSLLFNKGKLEHLWKWLNILEEEQELKNPHIIYYLGVINKYYIGDSVTSLSYLRKASDLFEKENDSISLIRCFLSKAGILLSMGKTQEVINKISKLLTISTRREDKASLLYYLAYSHFLNSDHLISINYLNQSLEVLEDNKTTKINTDINNLLGHINLIKGEFKTSINYYEEVMNSNPDILNKVETISNLVLLYSQTGNYVKSKEELVNLAGLIKNFPIPVFNMVNLLAKQGHAFESRNYEENIRLLNEINSIAISMNHKGYTYLSYRLLSETYYYANDFKKSKDFLANAEKLVGRDNELEHMEIAVVKSLLQRVNKVNETIEKSFLDAYNYYDTLNYSYSKAQICFHLAEYYIKINNEENAKKFLEESLNLCEQKEYLSYLYREYKRCEDTFNYALQHNINLDFINRLISSQNHLN